MIGGPFGCGSVAGYEYHIRRVEYPCRECRIAKRSFEAGRRYERKQLGLSAERESYAQDGRRDEYLIREYGINVAQYAAILEAQGGGCAICGATKSSPGARLSVDHDHNHCPPGARCSGCVRGLLCTPCNVRDKAAGDAWDRYIERRWAQSVLKSSVGSAASPSPDTAGGLTKGER